MAKYKVQSVGIKHGGKGWTVRRQLPNGKVYNVCECWDNAGFSQGCIAQVDVDLLQEVIDNHGHYAEGNFQKYLAQGVSKNRCVDCYSFTNMAEVMPRIVDETTAKTFDKFKPGIVRIGKDTEDGHPYYYATLRDFVHLATQKGARIIFPTRALPFGLEGTLETARYSRGGNDVLARLARNVKRYHKGTKKEHFEDTFEMASGEEMAEWFKRNGTSLMYTMGYENPRIQAGILSQGFSNDWLLQQALKYHSEGVNVSLILNWDVVQSFSDNEARGAMVMPVLRARDETGINVRILTRRFRSHKGMALMGVSSKHELTWGCYQGEVLEGFATPKDCPSFAEGKLEDFYVPTKKKNEVTAARFHPDFQKLVGGGVGVCGQVGEYEHCDKCNLFEGVRIRFPVSELAEVPKWKKEEWKEKRKRQNSRRKKGLTHTQEELDF